MAVVEKMLHVAPFFSCSAPVFENGQVRNRSSFLLQLIPPLFKWTACCVQMVGSCSCEGWKGSKALADEAASSLLGGTSATQRKMAGKMDRYQCSACHHPLIGTHSLPSPSPSSPSIFMRAWLVCGAHDRAKEPSHDGSVKTPHFSTGRSLFVLVPSASAAFLVPSSPLAQPATPPVSPRAQHTLGLCTGRGSSFAACWLTHKSTALLMGTSSRRARIDLDLPFFVEPLKRKDSPTSCLACAVCVRCAMCDVRACDDVWVCTKHRTRRVDAIGRGRTRTTSQRGAAHPQIDRVPRAKASHHRPARVLTTTRIISPSLLRCSSSPPSSSSSFTHQGTVPVTRR